MKLSDILSLGGTQEDLDLMAEVMSGDEIASSSVTEVKKEKKIPEKVDEKTLLNELLSFMKSEINVKLIQKNAFETDESADEQENSKIKEAKRVPEQEIVPLLVKDKQKKSKKEKKSEEKEAIERNIVSEPKVDDGPVETERSDTIETDKKHKKEKNTSKSKEKVLPEAEIIEEELQGDELDQQSKDKLKSIIGTLNKQILPKCHSKLLVNLESPWHLQEVNALILPDTGLVSHVSEALITSLYARAKQAYETELGNYAKFTKKSSGDKEFISTVLKSGTVTDRVSALTLLIQESPFHTIELLSKHLLHMATKKSRTQALLAIDSIKDLMITNILPDRKLNYFRDQSLAATNISNRHLAIWYFEDVLKKMYFEFIQILEELSKDPLSHVKNKVLFYISDLLSAKPEQEQNLLSLLVNKLGDQDKKLASKVVHLLLKLLEVHPNMKMVVAKEVEHVLFRSNISKRTQYYAITFLNQIPLSKREVDTLTANLLISLYFRLFESLVKDIRGDQKKTKPNEKKKIVKPKHQKRKAQNGGQPAKAKVFVKETEDEIDGIENKMLAGLLTGVNRAFPFSKIEDEAFEKQINTLFTIAHLGTFNISTQALTLIFQVQNAKQALSDRFYRVLYETLYDSRLNIASKQSMYLNLLYKALKHDVSLNRIRAFLKRLVQVCGFVQVPFACAALFLVSEIAKSHPGVWSLVDVTEDDDEEIIKDVLDDEDKLQIADSEMKNNAKDEDREEEDKPKISVKSAPNSTQYDALKREPLYANADNTYLYELLPLTRHFHPTISFYAKCLVSRQSVKIPDSAVHYDPLQNHTLSRFLDRFVYKNPKQVKTLHKGNSLMQPRPHKNQDMLVAGGKKRNVILKDQDTGKVEQFEDDAVNMNQYLQKEEDNVPVDELFFYKFFKQRQNCVVDKKKARDQVDFSDDDEELWGAIENSSGFPAGMKDEDSDDFDEFPPTGEIEYSDSDDAEKSDTLDYIGGDSEDNFESMDGIQIESVGSDDDSDIADNIGGDEVYSDGEMERLFSNDTKKESEKVTLESEVAKTHKSTKKLEEKAKSMGYRGEFFSAGGTTFASAADFEDVIAKCDEEAEQGDHDEIVQRPIKRKQNRAKFTAKGNNKKMKRM